MGKFTRGPWAILPEEADKDYIRIRGTILGSRYKIANVPTPTYAGVHDREAVETRANARLIAAAPDLLGALMMGAEVNTPDFMDWLADRLVNVHKTSPNTDFIISLRARAKAARAAISKATGESHG